MVGVLSHRDRPDHGPRGTAKPQRKAYEQEFGNAVGREILEVKKLAYVHSGLDQEAHVDRERVARPPGGLALEALGVPAHEHHAGLRQPVGSLYADPSPGMGICLIRVEPPPAHIAGANQHRVALSQLDVAQGGLQLGPPDGLAGCHGIDTTMPRDVDQDAPTDERRQRGTIARLRAEVPQLGARSVPAVPAGVSPARHVREGVDVRSGVHGGDHQLRDERNVVRRLHEPRQISIHSQTLRGPVGGKRVPRVCVQHRHSGPAAGVEVVDDAPAGRPERRENGVGRHRGARAELRWLGRAPGVHPIAGLTGRTAVVTGASSGIGTAVAVRLAADGARIVLVGRDAARLATVQGMVDGESVVVPVDLAAEGAIEQVVESSRDAFGPIGVLVHSAGVYLRSPIETATLADLDLQWRVNVRVPYALTQAALPDLMPGGTVIFVTSRAKVGMPDRAAYCATKAAADALMRSLALELAPRGVRVNAVAPGFIATPMNEMLRRDERMVEHIESLTPAGRLGHAEEVAAAIAWLASDEASFVHGHSLGVDGGYPDVPSTPR
jgi:NAD(P)-dependent dehydrogenase (short-subunit alcohol dehydrogenase family)